MIVICDTNFYRKLTESVGVRDTDRLDKILGVILEAEKMKNVKAMMGSVVASELMSHLVDNHNEFSFKSCLKGCYVYYKHCENSDNGFRLLPSIQTQISRDYFEKRNVEAENTQIALGQILSEITQSPTLNTLKKYSIQLQKNKQHIQESEQCLIEQIQTFCRIIDPAYKDWKFFVGDKRKREQYLRFINSKKFEEETSKAMLCSVMMQIYPQMNEQQALAGIKDCMIDSFIRSYPAALSLRKYFWKQLLNEHFDLTKKSRANFLWDEQILYFVGQQVNNEKIVLITSDKKMKEAAQSCDQGDFVMNYDEYLCFLGVKEKIEVLKVKYKKVKSTLISKILSMEKHSIGEIYEDSGRIYTYLNPVSYLTALENRELFAQMDGIFADGSLLVQAIRLVYGKRVTRRSFDMTSMAPELLEYAAKHGKTVYIVASKQEQVERAVEIFKMKWPNLQFAGYRNGYFKSEEELNDEAKHIVKVNPDFLIVGMGILIQEQFLLKLKNVGFRGIGFTCGGFIHQTAKNEIDYYPAWVDRMNLRFLYRMYKEPHTRKRYAQAALLFPVKFIGERLFG